MPTRSARFGPLICPSSAQAQSTIIGTVVDSLNQPLADVVVTLAETDQTVTTGQTGRFRLGDFAPGTHTLRLSQIGFTAVDVRIDVPVNGPPEHDLGVTPMTMSVPELAPLEVEADRPALNVPVFREFEQLERMGFGHLIAEDQIVGMHRQDVTDVLRRIPGIILGDPIRFAAAPITQCPGGATVIVGGLRGRHSRV